MSSASSSLCAYLASCRISHFSDEVKQAARRGVLDWLGCALTGSNHPSLLPLLRVLRRTSGQASATVFGNQLRLGIMDAALANGYMGHVLDFDDTHLGGTILHTSSPVLPALFALSEVQQIRGVDFLKAYVCGFEAGIRCGQASSNHHKGGWHLTGTLGCLAAGVATGVALRLDSLHLNYALGIAATQAAGMQQNRGTMCKYLHAGKAAAGGLLAGLLAQEGFDSALDIIDGKQGFSRIYSDHSDPTALVRDLGQRWEIVNNGYKPYASAAVLHPIIDAMREIRHALSHTHSSFDPRTVNTINLRLSPYAMSIAGVRTPETGMQSKFSVFHTAAVGLLDGDGGTAQYSDERARDTEVLALREKVNAVIVDSFRKEQCEAAVDIAGTTFQATIEHASGTARNPLSDEQLVAKFRMNAEPVIGKERAEHVLRMVSGLEQIEDMGELARLCA